jgi:nucleotide-binding universal stress UspA family protein
MNDKSTVVVGLKEKQPTALRFAAQAAIDHRATLRVIHCLDLRTAADFVSVPFTTFPPESWRVAGEAVLEEARSLVNELHPWPDADYVLADGRPVQTLRHESAGAAMLVVGVDAASRFGTLFGSSVTERLVSHSRIPVAVVPERAWPDAIPGPIFVAIDASTPASGPLRFAFAEADRTNHELHVAHVIPEADMFYKSMAHKINVSEVLAGWREEFPDVQVTHRFFFDDADEGCVRASEQASLLVLGRRTTQIFGHPVLSEIAKRTHCPCVVVPDDWKAH